MNAKTWLPLIAAVVLGLAAAYVAKQSLSRHVAAPQPKPLAIVVAKVPIPPGEMLREDQLVLAPIAGTARPADTFTSIAELVGRVTASPVVTNQALTGSLLAPKGSAAGLQALVPNGMRAITIDVTESSGVAGLLVPGCHVDVVTTTLSLENADKTRSRVIVQGAPVLAVGQRLNAARPVDPDAKGGATEAAPTRTVTLLVTPRDAEAVDLASTAARLRLVLRGAGDNEETDDEGVMMVELRGGSNLPPTALLSPPAALVPTVPTVPPPAATTQPTGGPAQPELHRRVVTVIQGGEERQIVFREERPGTPASTGNLPNTTEESSIAQ